jgi:hypothetical protein
MRFLYILLALSSLAAFVSADGGGGHGGGYGPPRESEGTRFLKRVVLAPKHALIGVRRIGGGLIALNGGLLRGTAYFTGVSPLRDKASLIGHLSYGFFLRNIPEETNDKPTLRISILNLLRVYIYENESLTDDFDTLHSV